MLHNITSLLLGYTCADRQITMPQLQARHHTEIEDYNNQHCHTYLQFSFVQISSHSLLITRTHDHKIGSATYTKRLLSLLLLLSPILYKTHLIINILVSVSAALYATGIDTLVLLIVIHVQLAKAFSYLRTVHTTARHVNTSNKPHNIAAINHSYTRPNYVLGCTRLLMLFSHSNGRQNIIRGISITH